MTTSRFDVLVVGAGPGGSVAALVLARGGARVALVDKAAFPRDKACGDLIGPRGVQLLDDLGLPIPGGPRLGPMVLVGSTGRRVGLPSAAGLTYPGYGVAARRAEFDAGLRSRGGRSRGRLGESSGRRTPVVAKRPGGLSHRRGPPASRLRDRRRRRYQPGGERRRPGAAGASAVGVRGARLSLRTGRDAADYDARDGALAGFSRLRLGLSGSRWRRQRRHRDRDRSGTRRRIRGRAGSPRLSDPPSPARIVGSGRIPASPPGPWAGG